MYQVVIGLEVHCELTTVSKNFSPAPNAFSSAPNTNIAAVDLGYPGILPVANEEACRKALKTAMALNCENPDEVMFDRKNYFYADLPKGYQITQMTKPMGKNGYLMINVDGEDKRVDIHQLHLEEDTASLDHHGGYSLIDYNRSGIPLIEIVTEPCIRSAKEALAFLEDLRSIFLYCGVSEAKSDKGQMRCDVNISLMKEGATELGTKVEMKNINSFSNVEKAIEYEIMRQTEVLESGGKVVQETRRFDETDLVSYTMRTKVDAVDYKYFVEPNIPPVRLTPEYLAAIRAEIPPLRFERINTYMEKYGLSRYDATVIVKEREIAEYFEKALASGVSPKLITNWLTGVLLGHLNKFELCITDVFVTPDMLADLIKMVESGKISGKQGKEVLYKCLNENKTPEDVVKELGIQQIGDEDTIRGVVNEVLDENANVVEQYKGGKEAVLNFLVGQVMKKTRGQANPTTTPAILKEEIAKR